jgi:hypothetical protein
LLYMARTSLPRSQQAQERLIEVHQRRSLYQLYLRYCQTWIAPVSIFG